MKSDHPKDHWTFKTGVILRTLPLLYRFKPFHWRVQDPQGMPFFLETERFVDASIYPWHVVWTRLVVSRGTQRPFSLYLPWKSKSTIEIIGFPQVDYSFSREFESSKIGVAIIWIVRLTSRVRNNTLTTKLPRPNGEKFCKSQSLKSSFRTRKPLNQFSIGHTSLTKSSSSLQRQGFMLWWMKNNPHRTCIFWVNWAYQDELLLRKGKKSTRIVWSLDMVPWLKAFRGRVKKNP